MTFTLTEEQRENLGYALDLAYEDQEQYLGHGNPALDYSEEWPEIRATKQHRFRSLGKLEDELFGEGSGDRWRKLADSLEEET